MSKSKKIDSYSLSNRASFFPHLELDNKTSTQEEMRYICNKLKEQLSDLTIIIYNKNTYCSELNGDWNVCFSVKENKIEDKYETYMYTYIIRSCDNLKKTFGCPFINYHYIYNLKTTALMESTNSELFNVIENKLMEFYPNAKKVDYFET